ncbi:hypothetical protein DYU11_08915 [Fibrisoma montanum]|uniref:Uracil-DNA glycosylase-like domain-containing protein n=2 Tax=Fibrisoma montanum TaxID=2305895 RepID=A0A418MF21_9BACT|nr:hypothetical protein DYU11_08915 [Fibrisoma montanum]
MNELLALEYDRHLQTLYKLIDTNKEVNEQPSWPFFMCVSNEYIRAPKKLLVVGQETYGWNNNEPRPCVKEAMDLYRGFVSSNNFHNSPFWWFRQMLAERIGISVSVPYAEASLWTNLSKIDVNKKRPSDQLFDHTMQFFIQLLVHEIDIVKPDIVLITTANGKYNWHMNHYFSQYKNWAKKHLESSVYQLHSEKLPLNTFQIAHPNSLRFKKGKFTDKANSILDVIERNLTM